MVKTNQAIADFIFHNNTQGIHVNGDSMQPLLSNGQAVKITPIKQPVRPGKCYVFIRKGVLCVHRLKKIRKEKFFFIGDTSQKTDHVSIDAIVAELDSKQNMYTIQIIRFVNLFFDIAVRIYPKCKILRVKMIHSIIKCERFLYERKI